MADVRPAGSGKYGLVDDVFMAARVQSHQANNNESATRGATSSSSSSTTAAGAVTRVLRTHPPAPLTGHGVSSLEFSGAYPVTRLRLDGAADFAGLADLEVYAFSTLRPMDLAASAVPAIALTLAVGNPNDQPIDASFMFNLPWSAMTDCQRLDHTSFSNAATDGASSSSSSSSSCTLADVVIDEDIPGNDLSTSPADDFEACVAACCANAKCGAVLFEAHSDIHMGTCQPVRSSAVLSVLRASCASCFVCLVPSVCMYCVCVCVCA